MSINLALNKTATASSYIKPFQPSRAVDANNQPEFRWICNTLPGWLNVDFGGEYYIDRWVVVHMGAAGWDSRYNTCNYYFQGSLDNTNWFTLDTVSYNTANTTDRTIAITKVRFVRVVVTGGIAINPQLASIVELQVYKAPDSPYLSGLLLSAGTLDPEFAKATTQYTASVPYDVASIKVTPTADDPKPTVTVNGTPVIYGQASDSINLDVGSNTITVVSTAADGLSQVTYIINITRASSPYLTRVDVTYKSGKTSTTVPVNIVASQIEYNANMPSTVNSITVTSYSQDVNASILVNGNQNLTNGQVSTAISVVVGTTRIPIVVTSGVGSDSKVYGISIVLI